MKSALLRLCFLALVGTSGLFAQGANAQLVGRIDHNVTDSYRVFGRFAHNRTVLTQPDSYGNVATPDPGAPLRAHPPPAWSPGYTVGAGPGERRSPRRNSSTDRKASTRFITSKPTGKPSANCSGDWMRKARNWSAADQGEAGGK